MDIKRIFLTGFMGSGKTTVGRILAKRMGLPFTDLDELIVSRAGMSISDIFEQQGEPAFREMETKAVETCSKKEGVFGLGGGAVLDAGNRATLMASGLLVYLKAAPQTLAIRLQHEAEGRPLLSGAGDLVDRIATLLGQRSGSYELAHWNIVTDDLTPEQVADILHHRIKEDSGD